MMRLAICILAIVLALTGCGRVAVYSDPELKGAETGIKFYTPKPYVLVKRTGAKAKPVEISVIYLPDLNNPLYAKAKPGFGSAKLDLTFTDGILSSFGQETDPKIIELVSTLAGVPLQLAEAGKARRETDLLRNESLRSEIPKAAIELQSAAASMKTSIDKQPELTHSVVTKLNFATLKLVQAEIVRLQRVLDRSPPIDQIPGIIEKLRKQAGTIEGIIKVENEAREATEDFKDFWGNIASANTDIDDAVTLLKKIDPTPKPVAPASVTLYEIVQTPTGGTQLRRVPMN